MNILPLYLAAGIALFMLLARFLTALLTWRLRVRQIRRRRERRGGYVGMPVFDDQQDPRELIR